MRALHRLNRIARDLERPESVAAWEEAHRAFHLTLIGGYGRPLLLQLCATLLNLNDRYRRLFPSRTGGDRDVAWEHGEIAQAAVVRDTDYACEKLAEHLARTGANLRRHLQGQAGDDRVKIGPAGAA